MTLSVLMLVLAALLGLVTGQVLLKFGMRQAPGMTMGRRVALVAGGIAAMTVWFMLWLGLLQRMDLSHLFPFEGLATVALSLAATLFLKERVSPWTWLAVLLISAGVALVGLS